METNNTLLNGLFISLIGIFVVLISLSFFSIIIAIIHKIDEKINEMRARKHLKSTVEEPTMIDPKIVAVITAAALETFKKPIKIKRIKFVDKHTMPSSWSSSGRLSIFESHKIIKGSLK